MSKIVKLYTVYENDIPHLTCHHLDPDDALEVGFDEFEPPESKTGEEIDQRIQFWIERPSKKKLAEFLSLLKKRGYTCKVEPYDPSKAVELGWGEWDGYTWGFKDAPSADVLVTSLLKECPEFKMLAPATIKCVFRKGKPTADDRGKYTLAYISLGAKSVKRLKKYDFVITIYEIIWDKLSEGQRERLIYHELKHAYFRGSPSIVDHDIEEFFDVFKRYNIPFGEDPYKESWEVTQAVLSGSEDEE